MNGIRKFVLGNSKVRVECLMCHLCRISKWWGTVRISATCV